MVRFSPGVLTMIYFLIAHILFGSFPLLILAYKIFQSRMVTFYLMKYAYVLFFNRAYICLFISCADSCIWNFQSRMVTFYLMKYAYFYFQSRIYCFVHFPFWFRHVHFFNREHCVLYWRFWMFFILFFIVAYIFFMHYCNKKKNFLLIYVLLTPYFGFFMF